MTSCSLFRMSAASAGASQVSAKAVGLAAAGFLLQYLPATIAMLILASLLAVGVLYCATMRALWRARWPA